MSAGMEEGLRGLRNLICPRRAGNEDGEAREIQERLLPKNVPQLEGFDIAAAFEPFEEVCGDYLDIFPLSGDRMALCIADVSGKGLDAAVLMSKLQEAVRGFAEESASPAELCTKVNQALSGHIGPAKYITMFYGVLDRAERKLRYENAGHCLPLLVRADGSIEFPASFSGVIGIFSHWIYQNQEVQLTPGDRLVLLTDGVIEARRRREEFGYQRLISVVKSAPGEDAEALSEEILETVRKFCRGKFRDEASLITVLVL